MKTKESIDALADALLGIGLPKYVEFRYFRPLSLAGATGPIVPALAVSPAKIDSASEDTSNGDYSFTDRLLLTWYAGAMGERGVQVQDQMLAADTLANVKLITNAVAGWKTTGLPGLAFQNEPTLGDVHFGHIHGGIWAVEISVSVLTWEM